MPRLMRKTSKRSDSLFLCYNNRHFENPLNTMFLVPFLSLAAPRLQESRSGTERDVSQHHRLQCLHYESFVRHTHSQKDSKTQQVSHEF